MNDDRPETDPATEPRPVEPIVGGDKVIPYAPRAGRNPQAVYAMVFGVMLLVPFAGVFAIYHGRRALAAVRALGAGREQLARQAIWLGKLNLVLTAVAAIVLPPLIIHARRQAR